MLRQGKCRAAFGVDGDSYPRAARPTINRLIAGGTHQQEVRAITPTFDLKIDMSTMIDLRHNIGGQGAGFAVGIDAKMFRPHV
jgi:hypothetical protein